MFKTKQEFQRLKNLKYGLLRRNWNKYSDETNNKYLQKKAKEFDVKVPKNIKAFEKYAQRIANKIEERQYLYTPENQEVIERVASYEPTKAVSNQAVSLSLDNLAEKNVYGFKFSTTKYKGSNATVKDLKISGTAFAKTALTIII